MDNIYVYFNNVVYVELYSDLPISFKTNKLDAWKHWKECGMIEYRVFPISEYNDVNVSSYINENSDFVGKIHNKSDAYKHYFTHGIFENRKICIDALHIGKVLYLSKFSQINEITYGRHIKCFTFDTKHGTFTCVVPKSMNVLNVFECYCSKINFKSVDNNVVVLSDVYHIDDVNVQVMEYFIQKQYYVRTNLHMDTFNLVVIKHEYVANYINLFIELDMNMMAGILYIVSNENDVLIDINNSIHDIRCIDKLKYVNDDQLVISPSFAFDNYKCTTPLHYKPTLLLNAFDLQHVDFELYRQSNDDLMNMNQNELINHYMLYGKYEKRPLMSNLTNIFYVKSHTFNKTPIFRDIFINFPQFHEDELNNKCWGKGWTDWTNIQKINDKYLKCDDKNERIANIGFYDYTDTDVRKYHTELCRKYDIYGMCYYYYYFDGVKALHKPIENMLYDGHPNTNFFLLWANEMWSKRWSTSDINENILINQTYDKRYWDDNVENMLKYFKHENYIVIDNKPLLGICVISDFASEKNVEMLHYFNEYVKQHGFDGICYVQYLNKYHEKSNIYFKHSQMLMERQPNYIINYIPHDRIFSMRYVENNKIDNNVYIFDEYNEERYVNFHTDIKNAIKSKQLTSGYQHWNIISENEKCYRKNIFKIYQYDDICKFIMLSKYHGQKTKMNGFFPAWDNESRILSNNPPNNICTKVINTQSAQNYIYFVKLFEKIRIENNNAVEYIIHNAFNEWGEGNIMEPCKKYGEQRLFALSEAKKQHNNNTLFLQNLLQTNKKIVFIFTHYGGGGTEKFMDIFKSNDNIIPIVIRPSWITNTYVIVSSLVKNNEIKLNNIFGMPTHNYDYFNIYYYEELNILFNFIIQQPNKMIFINSLYGFSNIMFDMINKLDSHTQIVTYLHDYYFLFNDAQINYAQFPVEYVKNSWNSKKLEILTNSCKIICPSYSTRNIFNKYIPNINIDVRYHCNINKSNFNNVIDVANKPRYKILIYGEIHEKKGLSVIKYLIESCKKFDFVIHGKTNFISSDNCVVNGPYEDSNLKTIISYEQPDVILFASIFCETFCYALIPALESIYPIICPNYGSYVELCNGRKNTYFIDPNKLNESVLLNIIRNFKNFYATKTTHSMFANTIVINDLLV